MQFETVIGLEVHSQLNTNSKIFCSCSTHFGSEPNTNICPVCTGQPGVLPVLNKKVVEHIVTTGLALNCVINKTSVFSRKQYYYPDLPKNYQISQYDLPVCGLGHINISVEGTTKRIGITRIHLEEDAGKLLHAIGNRELDYSLVDLNRTGVPLMEIVSEPDMRTPEEAYQYLSSLKTILEYLGVSECNMEEGKFRCDANVSIRPIGQKEFGTKAEIKNMNSLKNVRDALEFEVKRQTELILSGGKVAMETRLWDASTQSSHSMRSKEQAHDYRYFPEPDLLPLILSDDFIEQMRARIPELSTAKKARFISELGLSEYDAGVLSADKALSDYFEETLLCAGGDNKVYAKPICNWISTELLGRLNANNLLITQSPISPQNLAILTQQITSGLISGKIAKIVFEDMFTTSKNPAEIIKEKGLVQISDESAIAKICDEVIAENPKIIEEFKAGKERAIGSLVGAVMKKSQGKANPTIVNKILKEKLS